MRGLCVLHSACTHGSPVASPRDGEHAAPSLLQAIREVIAQHTGITPPPIPPRPRIHAYGEVHLDRKAALFDVLPQLSEPVDTVRPDVMEEYAQR